MNKVSQGVFKKFVRNAIFNSLGFGVSALLYLLITPYALSVLGKTRFGIWALGGVITSFAQFSNLGFDQAIIKYVAELWAKRQREEIYKLVTTASFSYAAIGITVMLALLRLKGFLITKVFHIPQDLHKEALFVFTGVIIIFVFNLIFSIFRSVLFGLQRIDITTGILIGSRVLSTIGVYVFLSQGLGLKGLVINSGIVALASNMTSALFVRKLMRRFGIMIKGFSVNHFKALLKYGVNIVLASLANLSRDPINKAILANICSLSFVTFYEVGNRLQSLVQNAFGAALRPLLPASSELDGYKDSEGVRRLYLTTSRIIFIFALPTFLYIFIIVRPFIRVWLGQGYEPTAKVVQIMLVGNFLSLFATPAYVISRGVGKPHLSTIVSIVGATSNLAFVAILGLLIGFYGIPIGLSLALIVSSALMFFLAKKAIRLSLRDIFGFIPITWALTMTGLSGVVYWLLTFVNSWNFVKLVGVGGLYAFICIFITYILMSSEDRMILKSLTGIRT